MYKFNYLIMPGDIILIRGPGKISSAIAKLTKGEFSHVMLCLQGERLIESITETGVQVVSFERISFRDKSKVRILRYRKDNKYLSNDVISKLHNNAISHQSRFYNWSGIRKFFKDSSPNEINGKKFFCSELIAQIYQDTGIELVERSPNKVSPNCLLESPFLEDITENVLVWVEGDEKEKCLDEVCGEVPQNAELMTQFIKSCNSVFREFSFSPPTRHDDIVDKISDPYNYAIARKLDKKIYKKYIKSGIPEFYKLGLQKRIQEVNKIYESNEIEQYMTEALSSVDKEQLSSIFLHHNLNMVSRNAKIINYIKARDSYIELNAKVKSKFFSAIIDVHDDIINVMESIFKQEEDERIFIIEKLKQSDTDIESLIKDSLLASMEYIKKSGYVMG